MKCLARVTTLLLLLAGTASGQLQSLIEQTSGDLASLDKAVMLAPGMISHAFKTRDFAITPEGHICFFSVTGIKGQRTHLAYMRAGE